jgi:hypothetical protein
VAFGASLVAHLAMALRLAEGMHSGVVGGVILALLGAALVPNGVLFSIAYVAGPGFALGTGTSVSPGGVRLGLLPDFPVLAAVPTTADARWLPALVVLPVLAGGVAGIVAVRRYPVFGIDVAALRGALAGLTGGVTAGLLTGAATGAIGPGRLQHVGPDVLATTAVCAVAFLLGGAGFAVGGRLLGGVFGGVFHGAFPGAVGGVVGEVARRTRRLAAALPGRGRARRRGPDRAPDQSPDRARGEGVEAD